MEWKPVESSQISDVGYDIETSTLGIRFMPTKKQLANGEPQSIYHYANVDSDTYYALMTADSVGKYFGATIKSDPVKYPFVRVA